MVFARRYTAVLFAAFSLLVVGAANASSPSNNLPTCELVACSELIKNPVLNNATLVVWQGRGEVIHTQYIDLANLDDISDQVVPAVASESADSQVMPSAPCDTGVCSVAMYRKVETTTEQVMITTWLVYFDGALINVYSFDSRTALAQVHAS